MLLLAILALVAFIVGAVLAGVRKDYPMTAACVGLALLVALVHPFSLSG